MKHAFLFLVSLLSFCFLESLRAATQVEGVATYEVFRSGGEKPLLRVEENFSAIFQGDKWLVDTKLVSIQPPAPPQLFCPLKQEAGSDGGDSYFLKVTPYGTNQDFGGWVEPGSIPNMAQSPSVFLAWLAYCSGSYLTNAGDNELTPGWVSPDEENPNRQGKCEMRVVFRRDPETPEFLDQLYYLSDGRMDPCNPSRDLTNLFMPPWSEGFTQAVFQVNDTIKIDGRKIPGVFTFELYGVGPERISPKLVLRSRMHGVVTSASTVVQPPSWLPELPENQNVEVRDYRFTQTVTNWQTVRYAVTNQFYQRTDSNVRAAVSIHAETKPLPPEAVQMREVSKPPINHARAILVAATALLLVLTSVWCLVKKIGR